MILSRLPVPIILASTSPRRRELLRQLSLEFRVVPAQVDETFRAKSPTETALELARHKAAAVARQYPDHLVIAADTVVVYQSQLLGKPRDYADAYRMLRLLAGDWHEVITGLVFQLQEIDFLSSKVELTRVHFKPLTDEEIEAYLAEGTALDKAGAYAIQGSFGLYVDRIEGCYYNVVGLPLARFGDLYKAAERALADLRKSRAKPNVEQ